jgi:hypothetical protein
LQPGQTYIFTPNFLVRNNFHADVDLGVIIEREDSPC